MEEVRQGVPGILGGAIPAALHQVFESLFQLGAGATEYGVGKEIAYGQQAINQKIGAGFRARGVLYELVHPEGAPIAELTGQGAAGRTAEFAERPPVHRVLGQYGGKLLLELFLILCAKEKGVLGKIIEIACAQITHQKVGHFQRGHFIHHETGCLTEIEAPLIELGRVLQEAIGEEEGGHRIARLGTEQEGCGMECLDPFRRGERKGEFPTKHGQALSRAAAQIDTGRLAIFIQCFER